MKRITRGLALPIFFLAYVYCAQGQAADAPTVSITFAVLSNALDTKTSARGDEVLMIAAKDLFVGGKLVIPKGSRIVGHIGGLIGKGKEEPKSVIAIAIDKAVTNGGDIPLKAIIAAVAAPKKPLPEDPTYAMMHSREPKMVGSGVGAASSGNLPPSSKAGSTATVATAQLKGRADEPLLLTEDSQGAFGYEDVAISWHLALPPPLTILASKAKRLRLEPGTQMLLRMVPPQLPN